MSYLDSIDRHTKHIAFLVMANLVFAALFWAWMNGHK